MKKHLGFYIAFWAVLLAVFNVIAFVSVGWIGYEKYTPAFWCGYAMITASFALNLIWACLAFRANSMQKVFYNLSYLRISYIGLILAFVVGGLFMLTSVVELWICILVCVITMGANTVAFIKAQSAATLAENVDVKVAKSTEFIRILRAEAQGLVDAAQTEESRQLAKTVSDALRFSDPVSGDACADTELQLRQSFYDYKKAILDGQDANAAAKQVLYLLETRNAICKAAK